MQPDPTIDPKPTMKPAITVVGMVAGKSMPLQSFRPTAVTSSAPKGNPNMKAKRHDRPATSLRDHGVQDDTAHTGDAAEGQHQSDRRRGQ